MKEFKIPPDKIKDYNRFRRMGWPKILCARACGMSRMPGTRPSRSMVRGCLIDEIRKCDYLPLTAAFVQAAINKEKSRSGIEEVRKWLASS